MDIYIFSWKAPKKIPSSLPLIANNSHLVVIGIQESGDDEKWKKLINDIVDPNHYILVSEKSSNHNILAIYVEKRYKDRVSNVELTKVKFKSVYNQYLSTKCAVIIRLTVDSTKISFIACQMEYGREYTGNRLQNLKDIHEYAFQ